MERKRNIKNYFTSGRKMQNIKIVEISGIILDFIGAVLLASAILHYSRQPWKNETKPRWERQRDEIDYIDEHLQKTRKITSHALIIISIGFVLTLTAISLKK